MAFAITAMMLVATSAASAARTADWQYHQTDGDRCWDAISMDANSNGWLENIWFDMDNDCRWDTRLYNTLGGEHFIETVTFDMNENGVPEYLMWDINQRVGFEWLYLDLNQDRRYEMRRIIPGSDLDYTTRINRQNASSAILHRFRMATGQSLLHPSFPTP